MVSTREGGIDAHFKPVNTITATSRTKMAPTMIAQRRSAAAATACEPSCPSCVVAVVTAPLLFAERRRNRRRDRSLPRSRLQHRRPRTLPTARGERSRRPRGCVAPLLCPDSAASRWVDSSFREQLAKIVDLRLRYRGAAVLPGYADIGHDGGNLTVVQHMRKGGHAVRPRILPRARGIAAIEHHANRVHRRGHGDRLVVRKRRV